jgi:hypothetical protein
MLTSEGLDEITGGPAGQLRFLLNASDMSGGIRGIAIEESDLSVEVTPRETVELIRLFRIEGVVVGATVPGS